MKKYLFAALIAAATLARPVFAGEDPKNMIAARAGGLPDTGYCADGSTPDAKGYCECPKWVPKGRSWLQDGPYCVQSYEAKSESCDDGYVFSKQAPANRCVWNGPGTAPIIPVKGNTVPRPRPPSDGSGCWDGMVSDGLGRCNCPKGYEPSDEGRVCSTILWKRHFGCSLSERDSVSGLCPCLPGYVEVSYDRCSWQPLEYDRLKRSAKSCGPDEKAVEVKDSIFKLAESTYAICLAQATKVVAAYGSTDGSCGDDDNYVLDQATQNCCPVGYKISSDAQKCSFVADNACVAPRPIIQCIPAAAPPLDDDHGVGAKKGGQPPGAAPVVTPGDPKPKTQLWTH